MDADAPNGGNGTVEDKDLGHAWSPASRWHRALYCVT